MIKNNVSVPGERRLKDFVSHDKTKNNGDLSPPCFQRDYFSHT